MAPGIHPPCTPSASCQPPRCHPTMPPCADPEKCMETTLRKNVKPCPSAASILATRAKSPCRECQRLKIMQDGRRRRSGSGKRAKQKEEDQKNTIIRNYLNRKSFETKLKRQDRLMGTHIYTDYSRSFGTPRERVDCCAGHGHRGRLSRERTGCCGRRRRRGDVNDPERRYADGRPKRSRGCCTIL